MHRRWNEPGTDFSWVAGDGSIVGDDGGGPDGVNTVCELLDWLLAHERVAEYSMWKVRFEMGALLPWQHRHKVSARPAPAFEPSPPECCDWPMQATRDGWRCREYCDGPDGIVTYR
jgi:hypothetical protein